MSKRRKPKRHRRKQHAWQPLQPFARATLVEDPQLLPQCAAELMRRAESEGRPMGKAEALAQAAELIRQEQEETTIWRNDRYQVADSGYQEVSDAMPPLRHLSIKRIDRLPIRDWRDLQAIKDLICGEDCEAMEIFPAASRLVDCANQYHLWVLPPGQLIPVGFFPPAPLVSDTPQIGKARQRPRAD